MAYSKPRSQKGQAVLCARVAQDKLAHDIVILDMNEIEHAPAAFFVIVTADSDAQVRAVTDAVAVACKGLGMGNARITGKTSGSWVILDFFDICVHVMLPEARDFYKLERLWGDAKAYTLTPAGAAKAITLSKRTV
ncbi:MAG: ribosome silencing factor [Candidatus Kapabacteria bacterium]|nr:ribosome silencing factor [Candidatus Kapabacteria bacterium]